MMLLNAFPEFLQFLRVEKLQYDCETFFPLSKVLNLLKQILMNCDQLDNSYLKELDFS